MLRRRPEEIKSLLAMMGGIEIVAYFADHRTPSQPRFASEVIDFGHQVSSNPEYRKKSQSLSPSQTFLYRGTIDFSVL
jgi:hypothetical protein